MRREELAKAMVATIDNLMSARKSLVSLNRAIKTIVGTLGRCNGKTSPTFWRPTRLKY
mgnify:CR=1 FL=1